ncbi:MAG: EF2563 family selenium-dependent molybdenum hydroxylase system protein [Peptococcaceae bacterium]|nr:EF2563 family selenium-dependent molybdenum hydroxylase system protein [Peptococcaceae bacterium]
MQQLVVIRGAGDLATGVAQRLWRAGFLLVMLEQDEPRMVRRTVSLATAVYAGEMQVEDIVAKLVTEPLPREQGPAVALLEGYWRQNLVPIVIDPSTATIDLLRPFAVVDAIMAKKPTRTHVSQAPIVVALGPGFVAGVDAHAIIETNRGHHLGRVLREGSAAPNTGIAGLVGGYARERVLRAPARGVWWPEKQIGDLVALGETVGMVKDDGQATLVLAEMAGRVRGQLYPRLMVTAGQKIGDIDALATYEDCFTISDKARSIAGGVLEALLWLSRRRFLP